MNDSIRQMVQPLLDAFNMYEIKSPALQSEVDDFRSRLTAFAEKYSDMMEYYNAFAASGLQEEYTDIISKVAVSSYGGTDNSAESNSESDNSNSTVPQITVRDFLAQYKPAYDEVCKRGSVRGKAAYDEVFRVADRTDDMIEAQIILEKERLLWNIVKEDALEIFETRLEEMDPLNLATTAVLLGQIKSYEESDSEEELEYRLAIQEVDDWKIITDYTCKMNLAGLYAKLIMDYISAKEMIYQWKSDDLARIGLTSMLKKKSDIRNLVAFAEENLGLSLNDIFDDPGVSIWMLNARSVDKLGKKKKINNPENLRLFIDLLENEILKDISIKEVLSGGE